MHATSFAIDSRAGLCAAAIALCALTAPASAGNGWFEGFEAPTHTLGLPPANGWARMDACAFGGTPVVGNFSGTVHTGTAAMRVANNDDVVQTFNITGGMLRVNAHVWVGPSSRTQIALLNGFVPGICGSTPPTYTEAVTFEADDLSTSWFLGGQATLNGLTGSLGATQRWTKVTVCADLTLDTVTVSLDDVVIATGAWTDVPEPLSLVAVRIKGVPAFGAAVSLWDSISVEQYDTYPKPSTYCTAKLNSGCCYPTIGSFGFPKHLANADEPFFITCSQMTSEKHGLFFFSTTGPHNAPFKGGTLCARAPIMRTPLRNSGGIPADPGPPAMSNCSGSMIIDFNQFASSYTSLAALQAAGTIVWGQWWARDADILPCFDPQYTQLSDAIEFVLN